MGELSRFRPQARRGLLALNFGHQVNRVMMTKNHNQQKLEQQQSERVKTDLDPSRFRAAIKKIVNTPKPSDEDLAKSNPEREDAPDAEREKDKKSG